MSRKICDIANEIRVDWKRVNYAAEPYLEAMHGLKDMNDTYGIDSAHEIVARFLCNASTWRGQKAREIKLELNKMLARVSV